MSVVSRLGTLALALMGDWMLEDHTPHGVESFDFQYSSNFSKTVLHPFVRWDSVHMLKIAAEGYTHEHQLVFFPLFPAFINWTASILLSMATLLDLNLHFTYHEMLLISALSWNILFFALACAVLQSLIRTIAPSVDKRTFDGAILLFCCNPASVFFAMVYTESLFAFLSWLGFLMFAQGYDLASAIPLCLASLLRSNGSLNVIVIGFMWLRRCSQKSETPKHLHADSSVLLVFSAIVMPIVLLNMVHLHILCSESLVCTTCLCPVDIANLLPTLSSWFLRSTDADSPLLRLSTDAQTLALCELQSNAFFPPVVYTYLQSKYWNVGFLRQYQWKQIPNFLLALPIWCISIHTIYAYLSTIYALWREEHGANGVVAAIASAKKSKKKKNKGTTEILQARASTTDSNTDTVMALCSSIIKRPETPYIAHLCALLLVGMFFAHVQVSTRLMCSASPFIYLGMAQIAERQDWKCVFHTPFGEVTVSWVYVFVIVYSVLGTILHCNYYPWT